MDKKSVKMALLGSDVASAQETENGMHGKSDFSAIVANV
jgi:hypothetical protein